MLSATLGIANPSLPFGNVHVNRLVERGLYPIPSAETMELVVVKDVPVMLTFLCRNSAKLTDSTNYSGILCYILGLYFLFVFLVFLWHFPEIINLNHGLVKSVNSSSMTLIRFSGRFLKKSRADRLSL